MATKISEHELDIQEQMQRIKRLIAESDQRQEEMHKIRAETNVIGWNAIFQAMLATAALLGAGAAIAKVFFP